MSSLSFLSATLPTTRPNDMDPHLNSDNNNHLGLEHDPFTKKNIRILTEKERDYLQTMLCYSCSEPLSNQIVYALMKRASSYKCQLSEESSLEMASPQKFSPNNSRVVPSEVLSTISEQFHSACFMCSKCGHQLSELDKTCWYVDTEIICSSCKHRMTHCHRCKTEVSSDAWVHKLNDLPFHISCFTCSVCLRQLAKGEHCGMLEDRLLCHEHLTEILTGKSDSGHEHNGRPKTKRVRTSFTPEQLAILQSHFDRDHNPDGSDLEKIANSARLNKRVTQVWFQNARARKKKNEKGVGDNLTSNNNSCNADNSTNSGRPPSSCSSISLSPSLSTMEQMKSIADDQNVSCQRIPTPNYQSTSVSPNHQQSLPHLFASHQNIQGFDSESDLNMSGHSEQSLTSTNSALSVHLLTPNSQNARALYPPHPTNSSSAEFFHHVGFQLSLGIANNSPMEGLMPHPSMNPTW